jgi:hypothetical protein
MDEAQELARLLLAKTNIETLTLKQGIVASISGSGTLGIYLSAEQTFAVTGIHYLKSYTPKVGDAVWCVKNGPDLIVLGNLAVGGELKDLQIRSFAGLMAGSAPPAGTQLSIITANVTGLLATFAGLIFLPITMPATFPNGLVSITIACTYQPNAGTGPHSIGGTITTSAFNIIVPGGTVGGAAGFSYTATGW